MHRLLALVLVPLTLSAGCAETKSSSSASSSSTSSSSSGGTPSTPPPVSQVEGGADPTTGVVRYLALGDSFTFGAGAPAPESGSFPARLSERWRAKGCTVDLKNVAVSGYTTSDVITLQLPTIEPAKPTFISLAIGANDIVKGVTVDQYRANVRKILEAAKASGARVIVLPQPEWPRSPAAPSYGTPSTMAEQRLAFDAALAEEAKAKGAEWVDLRLLMKQQADQNLYASDGLHPSAEAYDAWAGELARVIPSPCTR